MSVSVGITSAIFGGLVPIWIKYAANINLCPPPSGRGTPQGVVMSNRMCDWTGGLRQMGLGKIAEDST